MLLFHLCIFIFSKSFNQQIPFDAFLPLNRMKSKHVSPFYTYPIHQNGIKIMQAVICSYFKFYHSVLRNQFFSRSELVELEVSELVS